MVISRCFSIAQHIKQRLYSFFISRFSYRTIVFRVYNISIINNIFNTCIFTSSSIL
nr:MAG TPA: hypothetical protein [Caudoviricetes sp.]